DERFVRCTCSIGFAAYPLTPSHPEATPWQDVVGLADAALYDVKHTHRNGWAGYFAVAPEAPSRPVDEWVPGALRRGVLQRVASDRPPLGDGASPRQVGS
ncbi:MAG: hypothetical protein AAFX85_19945, partial [Pseudomonadota bacterium]